jgi:hypothetical protein
MDSVLARRHLLALSATATLAAALGGCATAPPTAQRMDMPPMGTVTTYHRVSSGSLGAFDGQVVWTHAPATWEGKPVIAFGAPQAGVALHDPVSFAHVASLTPSGKPYVSYDPPIDYAWPLTVGKAWRSANTVTVHATGQKTAVTTDFKVTAFEKVTVPAGTFNAYRIEWVTSQGESETRWVAPAEGIATVKRHVERVASHPQGPGVLDAELLSRVLPSR